MHDSEVGPGQPRVVYEGSGLPQHRTGSRNYWKSERCCLLLLGFIIRPFNHLTDNLLVCTPFAWQHLQMRTVSLAMDGWERTLNFTFVIRGRMCHFLRQRKRRQPEIPPGKLRTERNGIHTPFNRKPPILTGCEELFLFGFLYFTFFSPFT